MLKPYQRRAFLVLAAAALESATKTATYADDSLWDALVKSRNFTPVAVNTPTGKVPAAPLVQRRALGPVPGFTLPVTKGDDTESLFAKRKKRSSGLFGPIGDWFNHLQSATGTKINATGRSTLSLRMESVSGNRDAYQQDQYYGRGSNGVYNDTNLSVDATFLKYFHYRTTITNSPFQNPNDNRVKLDYDTKKIRLEWGDINAGFQGNSLIEFNRYLSGIRLSNEWTPRFHTTLLYSQTKAGTRTITIQGNNSTGPYYVYAGQIVEGSDRVRVNDQELQRGSDKDYTLDLLTGELNFMKGHIILPTDTVAVTFETLGVNQQGGNIYGIRTDYALSPRVKAGFTYVAQTTRNSSGLQTHTQQFYGHTNPAEYYTLDYAADATKPISVTVDGVPLVQGVDYTIVSTQTNLLLLRQSVLATSFVSVTYVPLNVAPTPGNRSVLGFDGSLSLGRLGSLTLETALSGLSINGDETRGRAAQLRADLNPLRNLHTTLTLRDVGAAFSSIESPGFNRNEKSIDIAGDYSPFKNLRLNFDWQKAKRPSYSGGLGISQYTPSYNGMDTYNSYTLGVNYSFAKNATLNLSRNSLSTLYVVGGNSKNVNDTLSLNYTLRSISFEAALSRNVSNTASFYDPVTGTDSLLYNTNSSTLSRRFGMNWRPLRWLDLTGSISDNDITTDAQQANTTTHAKDAQLGARISLTKNIRLGYSYQLSDTGNYSLNSSALTGTGTTNTVGNNGSNINLSTRSAMWRWLTRDVVSGGSGSSGQLGSNSTYGTQLGGGSNYNLGSYGNYSGYYGTGVNNGYGQSSYGGRSATHRFTVDYQPRANMQVGLSFDKSNSLGDYQFNSNRNNLGMNFAWQLSDRLQVNANYSLQRVAYTGNYGNTDSNSLFFTLQGRPFGGKLGIQLGWQSMKTQSTVNFSGTTGTTTDATTTPTDTSTNLSSLSARLDYPISSRQTLFVELLQSTSSGYLANTDSNLRFGMDFALNRVLRFSLGWQILSRTNADVSNQPYNYHVSSLLAEFGLNF